MGMHNLGEKRWGSGFVDDIRSHTDAKYVIGTFLFECGFSFLHCSTRVIGDFTKSVVLRPIVERMEQKMKSGKDNVWRAHFRNLPDSVGASFSTNLDEVLVSALGRLVETEFRRERLQTR